MGKNCTACNAELSGHTRFRDSAGNYYCQACMQKTQTAKCEICGKDTSAQRSFFRTDGTLYCEACFQAAANPEPAITDPEEFAPQNPQSQAEPRSVPATPQSTVPPTTGPNISPLVAKTPEPVAPTTAPREPAPVSSGPEAVISFREVSSITDIPEPGFGLGILALAIVVGVLAGMFSGHLVLMPLVAGVVCLVHWVLMRVGE